MQSFLMFTYIKWGINPAKAGLFARATIIGVPTAVVIVLAVWQ